MCLIEYNVIDYLFIIYMASGYWCEFDKLYFNRQNYIPMRAYNLYVNIKLSLFFVFIEN